MATKPTKVEVEIVATDEASPKIDRLEKKIDGLEADEARIVVTADITRLENQLAGSRRLMEQMEGDELTVQMRVTGRIEEELRQAQRLFDELDGKTGTVTITANASQLEAEARRASTAVDDIGRSAQSSRSVLANAIGNSTQDLGALGGVAGTTGVAIGQMGEYMADAAADGERFGVILRNFAAVAGPLAALTVGLQAISSVMADMRKGQAAEKAFDDEQVTQFSEALQDTRGDIAAYNAALEETGEVLAETGQRAGPAWLKILPGGAELSRGLQGLGLFGAAVEDILPTLNRAGIESERWSEIVTADDPVRAMDILRGALDRTNLSVAEQSDILIAARAAQENYATATENSAAANEFFESSGVGAADAASLIQREIERGTANFDRFGSDGVENMNAIEEATDDTADAVSDLRGEFDSLLGRLDRREAVRNARDALDELREAAEEAYIAVVSGADDAEKKQRDYEESIDETIRVLIAAGEDPITINTVIETLEQGDVNAAIGQAQALLDAAPPLQIRIGPISPRQLERLSQQALAPFAGFAPTYNTQPVAGNVTIINPPGTPAATAGQLQIFTSRNGDR